MPSHDYYLCIMLPVHPAINLTIWVPYRNELCMCLYTLGYTTVQRLSKRSFSRRCDAIFGQWFSITVIVCKFHEQVQWADAVKWCMCFYYVLPWARSKESIADSIIYQFQIIIYLHWWNSTDYNRGFPIYWFCRIGRRIRLTIKDDATGKASIRTGRIGVCVRIDVLRSDKG